MKKVYKTNCQINGNSCWTSINSYPCFQLQVGGLCFGVPSSTCICYYQTPSDYLNILELAQVIDWHMKFDDKPMWEEPND